MTNRFAARASLLILLLACASQTALSQDTSFTYQGQLADNALPANGSYDLRFSVFAVPAAGSPLVPAVTNTAVPVAAGLFTTTLDFGPGVFTGPERWLEISVRTNGGTDFNTLLPRQRVSVAPYAVRAAEAGSVPPGSIVASMLSDGAVTAAKLAPGAVSQLGTPDGLVLNAAQVSTNGSLGIGTAAPSAGLHIAAGPALLGPRVIREFPDGADNYNNLGGATAVAVSSNLLAVAANWDNAVTIVDVTFPTAPQLRSQIVDESGIFTNLAGASGVAMSGRLLAVAASADHAVTLIDLTNAISPVRRALIRDGSSGFNEIAGAAGVAFSGGLLAVAASSDSAVTLVGVTNPASPVLLVALKDNTFGFNDLAGAQAVAFKQNLLAVAAPTDNAVSLLNVTLPSNPSLVAVIKDGVGGFNDLAGARAVHFSGDLLIIASGTDSAVTLVDISNPAVPILRAVLKDGTGLFQDLDAVTSVVVRQNLLMATSPNGSVTLADISDPTAPVFRGVFKQGQVGIHFMEYPGALTMVSNIVVVAGGVLNIGSLTFIEPVPTTASLATEGWVGIGTTQPRAALHVAGNLVVESADVVEIDAVHFSIGPGTVAPGYAAFAAGLGSKAFGTYSLAIGNQSSASGEGAVALGNLNSADGYGSVALGTDTGAAGHYSMAAGRNALAVHDGSFVWGDSQASVFSSSAPNQFVIRAAGGVGINTTPASALHLKGRTLLQAELAPATANTTSNLLNLAIGNNPDGFLNGISFYEGSTSAAMSLGYDGTIAGTANNALRIYDSTGTVRFSFEHGGNLGLGVTDAANPIHHSSGAVLSAAGAWVNASSRLSKENLQAVSPGQTLEKLLSLPLFEWNYRLESAEIRHLGPMAEDFHQAFGLGGSDKTVSTIDPAGVALAAIQGLNEKLISELERRDAENAELKSRLDRLERKLNLKQNKP